MKIDTHQINSSQALAIDWFGTIKNSPERDLILNSLVSKLGLPEESNWKVCLECADEYNRLEEKRQTLVDAVTWNVKSLIFFECKFTESGGDSCSQTQKYGSKRNLQ